ncbi:MAG: antitoxin [Actinomycetota bacterium]
MFDKAKDLASSNKDKIKDGIDKGKGVIKGKVGGHDDKVDQGAEMAKDALDKLDDGDAESSKS